MENLICIILSAITVIALAIYLCIENKKRVRFGLIVALIVWAGILAIAAFTQWLLTIIYTNK